MLLMILMCLHSIPHIHVITEPPMFVTRALQQTHVECTWDQGDEERERKLTQYHKWHELDEDDLGAYLASSSSEEEEEEEESGKQQNGKGEQKLSKEQKRKKLRSILLGGIVEGKRIRVVLLQGGLKSARASDSFCCFMCCLRDDR